MMLIIQKGTYNSIQESCYDSYDQRCGSHQIRFSLSKENFCMVTTTKLIIIIITIFLNIVISFLLKMCIMHISFLQEVHQLVILVLQQLVRPATPSHYANVRIIIRVLHHGYLCSYIYESLILHMNLNKIEYLQESSHL